jgi:phage-related protein
MRGVKVHDKARDDIRSFPRSAKKEIGELLLKLQFGVLLGMPKSRPIPSLHPGAHELRIKDAAGIYRVFLLFKI